MGKPGGRRWPSPLPERIGQGAVTRGSETSQYPQEEKAKAIPLVVVSERGRGQTRYVLKTAVVAYRGLRDHSASPAGLAGSYKSRW
jgi:hypothetical protein